MNINSAYVSMVSAYTFQQKQSINLGVEFRPAEILNNNALLSINSSLPTSTINNCECDQTPLEKLSLEVAFLKAIVEKFTGKKLIFADVYALDRQSPINMDYSETLRPLTLDNSFSIDVKRYYEEIEVSHFSSKAIVTTKDGREINIDINL